MGDEQVVAAIRLTVPAQPDFVAVLRVAARVLAGRAGREDDARTRLQGAVGTAFFAITRRVGPSGVVVAELRADADRVEMTLLVEPGAPGLEPADVADLGTDHELSPDGRSLQLWVRD